MLPVEYLRCCCLRSLSFSRLLVLIESIHDVGDGGVHDTGGSHIRARLSPSLATGLVGLKENVFIGDFFRTMSFLPVTAERWA